MIYIIPKLLNFDEFEKKKIKLLPIVKVFFYTLISKNFKKKEN